MTDSPDSACEADNVVHQEHLHNSSNGNTIKTQSPLQEQQVRPTSPFVPPPPPPPPVNGFPTQQNGWALVDSDGDSGIMRLGSTSSSETDHSSSGFPDNYLSKLQVKHFTWIPPKPNNPLVTPIRGDHSISTSVAQPRSAPPQHPPPVRPFSWQRQRSMSVADVRRLGHTWTPAINPLTHSNRPLSLNGLPFATSVPNRPPMRCSCHTACIHCGSKFNRNFLRSTSDIPSGAQVELKSNKSSMNVYERLLRQEEDLLLGNDMIKVHARPVSVIPESVCHRVTPRQAKSADAALRQRRLQKAYSMTSALDKEECVKAHASIASVVPMADRHVPCGQYSTLVFQDPRLGLCNSESPSVRLGTRPVTPYIGLKQNCELVLPPRPGITNRLPMKMQEGLKDKPPPLPPPVSQSSATYAKVNKLHKSCRSSKAKNGHVEGIPPDDNEPPLPPRNYKSDGSSKGSFAEKMQGLTRSAKEALRKAFGFDCHNDNHHVLSRNARRSQRKSVPPSIPVVQRQRAKDQEPVYTTGSGNYVEI